MKRLLVTMSAALALTIVPTLVPGVARADTSVVHTFAVGGGNATCLLSGFCPTASMHVAFSAHCDVTVVPFFCVEGAPGITPPTGHAVFRFTDASGNNLEQVQGTVTCLDDFLPLGTLNGAQIKGGFASFTVQVTKATGNSPPTMPYLTFEVYDSGQQSADSDMISDPQPTSDPQDCLIPPGLDHVLTSGNLTVALQSPLFAVPLQGSWWSVDSAGNLYILDNSGNWVLVQ